MNDQDGYDFAVNAEDRAAYFNFWYPRTEQNVNSIHVGLIDVRASRAICISFDFERDGWKIEMPTIHSWAADDTVQDEGWKEVAFVPAWATEETP